MCLCVISSSSAISMSKSILCLPLGQRYGKGGGAPLFALHVHLSAVLLYYAEHYREPQPRAPLLGGVKRLEYLLQVLGLDAGPGVRDRHHHVTLAARHVHGEVALA